ncbi:MAG: hypothetical protein OQK12_11675 [Motiliproteus sp.]|nr:hypothetical protein [Motiliproteus sp.]MCW9053772.1 hypothetical protein [Motiliproteus sp.]
MNPIDQLQQIVVPEQQQEAQKLVEAINSEISELNENNQQLKQQLSNLLASLQSIVGPESSEKDVDQVAEHQRLCEQFNYRDRLLVQEFYFSIVLVGLCANFIRNDVLTFASAVIALIASLLLATLWCHLRHLRSDRDLMWSRARTIESTLGISVMDHIWQAGYEKDGQKKRMLSGTSLMVWAVGLFSLTWLIAALGIFSLIYQPMLTLLTDWIVLLCPPPY